MSRYQQKSCEIRHINFDLYTDFFSTISFCKTFSDEGNPRQNMPFRTGGGADGERATATPLFEEFAF
jgi:hypothetical protein